MKLNLQQAVAFVVLVVLAVACSGCAVPDRTDVHAGPRIVAASEWGGTPGPVALPHQTVSQITVHHQGERWVAGSDVAAYLRRLQQWSRNAKGWVDIPYHFVIGPDGTVYAGRSPLIAGDTNTEYNPYGQIQVMLLGNFEEQTPTPEQWDSAVRMLAHLLSTHDLPASSIAAHRHRSTQTVCPGAHLMARFEALRAAAASRAGRR
jgi:hypothetical protein